MKVYVAGPMSGYPQHNFPSFRAAADILRKMGHEVTSPVEMDEADGFDETTAPQVEAGSEQWAEFLARDVKVVADVDAVVVIDGWERSRGAALEVHVARELGKPVFRLQEAFDGEGELLGYRLEAVKAPTKYQPPSGENVLEEAQRIVAGDRGDDYGHPRDDFARTAAAWAGLFGWDVTARQVALAMVVVKLSRLQETPDKRDSIVDIAGYARTYEMCLEREGAAAQHYPTELPPT